MRLRTKHFESHEAADKFEVPEGARNFKIHAGSIGPGLCATWYERTEEERRWGPMKYSYVRPALLGLEVNDRCTRCHAEGPKCRSGWSSGRKCCPDCTHGTGCHLIARPQMTFRPQGIALLGVERGAQITDLRVDAMSIGASADPVPAELFQGGPFLLDKLGELGITEVGQIEKMVEPAQVGKLIEALETYTPFVCHAFNWPTCHLGNLLSIRLEGLCRGAILWGLVAGDYVPESDEPR